MLVIYKTGIKPVKSLSHQVLIRKSVIATTHQAAFASLVATLNYREPLDSGIM